jgi:hypothetical protein
MINNTVGGHPVLQLQWQQQLLRLRQAEQKRKQTIRGVWWLNPSKAASKGASVEERTWVCPRCGSRNCIRTNPGNLRQPIYCCVICGYQFGATANARLLPAFGLG